ncbi:MAG: glutathione S-transferase family protein [Alphaproteobacteria bacterium]|nr:glutathione S-transferase family protein [Alphaproteobacteria bacterium]
MKIELYYAPNTCALVPFVTLSEAGADFETKPLNFRKQQQMSPAYLAINPKHKVPLLVVDGKTLSENPAMAIWIARAFPRAKLLPADPWQEAQAISIHSWCAAGIHPHLSRVNSASKYCGTPGSEESIKAKAAAMIEADLAIADTMLAGREYLFDHFTSADAHLFWCLRRASQLGINIAQFTQCQKFFDRMLARPSVQKIYAFEKKVQEEFSRAA